MYDAQPARIRPRQQGRAWQLVTLLYPELVTELTVVIGGKDGRLRVIWREGWLRQVMHQGGGHRGQRGLILLAWADTLDLMSMGTISSL